MIDSVVSISEQAFFSIVTSALEAYKLEQVLACGDSAAGVETFGHLWRYLPATHWQKHDAQGGMGRHIHSR